MEDPSDINEPTGTLPLSLAEVDRRFEAAMLRLSGRNRAPIEPANLPEDTEPEALLTGIAAE